MKVTARALAVILAISIPAWFSVEAQAQSLGAGFYAGRNAGSLGQSLFF